jgi:hypothetical protein
MSILRDLKDFLVSVYEVIDFKIGLFTLSEDYLQYYSIKVNHFGHLKNFLAELTSILLDKGIINNLNQINTVRYHTFWNINQKVS